MTNPKCLVGTYSVTDHRGVVRKVKASNSIAAQDYVEKKFNVEVTAIDRLPGPIVPPRHHNGMIGKE